MSILLILGALGSLLFLAMPLAIVVLLGGSAREKIRRGTNRPS